MTQERWWRDEYYIPSRENDDRRSFGEKLGLDESVPEDIWRRLRAKELEDLRKGRELAARRKVLRATLREAAARAREEGLDVDEAVQSALKAFVARERDEPRKGSKP